MYSPTTDVLVVEDDQRLLRLICLLLQLEGFEVEGTGSGHAALRFIEEHRPRLVILDLNMPEMPGDDLWQQALAGGHRGAVLVLSADSQGRLRSAAIGAAFIPKPFDPEHVIETVRDLLQPGHAGFIQRREWS